jgi:putative ABC transport system permease protein
MIVETAEAVKIAGRSLMQHKLRSGLSVLGVVCGVMAVLAMIAVGEGAKEKTLKQIGELGIRNIFIKAVSLSDEQIQIARERLSDGLRIFDRERILSIVPDVDDIACLIEIRAAVISTAHIEFSPQIVACSPNYAAIQRFHVSQGRFLNDQDISGNHLVCAIGADVARQLGINGQIGNFLRIENELFKIIGVLDRYYRDKETVTTMAIRNINEMVLIPLGAETLLASSNEVQKEHDICALTEMIVLIKSAETVFRAGEVIKRTLDLSHNGVKDYQIIIPLELLRQAQRTQRIFNLVLGAIAAISLLVGGIGIMNIMLASVSERTKEIGIRRALGATRLDITLQFLAEAFMMTLMGGCIGIVTGIANAYIISQIAGWNTSVTFSAIFLPLVMSISVGLFFGLYPAVKAAKMDPIKALRTE